MLKVLQEISKRALLLNEYDFNDEQLKTNWLGNIGATDDQIEIAQKNLQIAFPDDYISFLKLTNGFPQCIRTGVTFLPIEKVDYLINVDEDLVEIWNQHDVLDDTGQALAQSILVGGLHEEQYFLLIPPTSTKAIWRYWKFASWIPGEHEFKNIKDYFKAELSFLKEETKGLKKAKPKLIVDYSLRDQVFNSEWTKVFDTAFDFLMNEKLFGYYNRDTDLLSLLLLSASKLNRFKDFEKILVELKANKELHLDRLIPQYEEAARNKLAFVDNFQFNKFSNKQPPITLEQIEEQIKVHRPDLLKPKNLNEKVDYQLYFLFEYGDATKYIEHYEANTNSPFFNSHLRAAIVYATIDQINKAKVAIQRYFDTEFNYTPLTPFLDKELLRIMDDEFSKQILASMTEKYT